MRKCQCGSDVDGDICSSCGKTVQVAIFKLKVLTAPPEVESVSFDQRTLFAVSQGKAVESGEEFEIKGKNTLVGKKTICDICLQHPTVSKKHAEIVHEDGILSICDLSSTNGTYVNGESILPDTPRMLSINDRIVMGKYELQVLRAGE